MNDADGGGESGERPTAEPSRRRNGAAVRTSIVIPAYDESGNVGPLTEELVSALDTEAARPYGPYEIVFVDDGSTDDTRDRLTALADDYDRVRAVFLRRNFGQSSALAAGIDHAAGDRIVTMDGDRQNDPADVPRLLDELEGGYDCVKGWRKNREDPLRKTIPSAIQTRLAWLTGPRIHDYVCGIAAYRTAAIRDIAIYGESHRYVPAILAERGYRVTEREVNHRSRSAGQSKYGPRRLLRGFVDLLFYAYWARFARRPFHALGGAAVVVLALAAGLLALTVAGAVSGFVPPLVAWVATVAVAGTGLACATVLAVGGLLAETRTRRHYRRARPYRVDRVVGGRAPTPGASTRDWTGERSVDDRGGTPGDHSTAGRGNRTDPPRGTDAPGGSS